MRGGCLADKGVSVIISALVVLCLAAAAADARDTRPVKRTDAERATCDAEFERIAGGDVHAAASADQIASWRALEPRCSGTGLYEARLVGLLTSSQQIDEARKVALAALERPLDSKRELLSGLANIDLQADNYALALDYADRLVKSYPEWSGGYVARGDIYLWQRKFASAVEAYEASYQREQRVDALAQLCIAYWGVSRFDDSARALRAALKADQNVMRYTGAIAAGAESLVKTGEVEIARQLLAMHAKLVPEARKDKYFLRSVKVVADAMNAAKPK